MSDYQYHYDEDDLPERIPPSYSGNTEPMRSDHYRESYSHPAPGSQQDPAAGYGFACLVLGIVAVFSVFFSLISIICSVAAIVLYVISSQKSRDYGMEKPHTAIAGLVCAITALIIRAVSYLLFFGFFAWLSTQF